MIYPDSFEQKIGFDVVRTAVSERCLTVVGGENVRAMCFSSDFDDVRRRLTSVAEMKNLLETGNTPPLYQTDDLAVVLNEITVAGTYLQVSDLRRVCKVLKMMSELRSFVEKMKESGILGQESEIETVASGLQTFPQLVVAIESIVDEFGNVKDSASEELLRIRRSIASMSGSVNSAIRRVLAKAVQEGIVDSDAGPTIRDGRLVIPVAPMNKRKINGIVHDESATGKTIFIEPAEVVEINNRIRELHMEERREVIRILTAMCDSIRPHIPEIKESYLIVGQLDFIHAKARYAQDIDGNMPSVSDVCEIDWYHACHPVLLQTLSHQGKEVVPLDIRLDRNHRILVISGPNAGGKSVCLKTVGIVQYMTQCGLLPPVYDNSHFGIFKDLFVDIGDDQSIENELSTYSSHLKNMKFMLSRGRKTSLLLIDEFGGGTEPMIGAALAQAILDEFNKKKMWGVVTTHYQNLKKFADDTHGLVNGSMLYDRHLMQPLFKLAIGSPGSSFAVEIARKIGLPDGIISEAEKIVGSDYINMDKYLLDIARDRKYWENKRQTIKQKEKRLDDISARLESDAETLREKRREIIDEARKEAEQLIAKSNSAIERTIMDIRKSQAEKQKTQEARQRLRDELKQINEHRMAKNEVLDRAPKRKKEKHPQKLTEEVKLEPGMTVKLDGEGMPGQIVEISGKNATVIFGMLRTTVDVSRLKPTNAKVPSATSGKSSFVGSATTDYFRQKQLSFNPDIDVRGMRVDEALQAITYFIDDALQFAIPRVRILHGTGTGALRQSIRQYLDGVRGVRSYRDEHVQFGGAGITVVDLE